MYFLVKGFPDTNFENATSFQDALCIRMNMENNKLLGRISGVTSEVAVIYFFFFG